MGRRDPRAAAPARPPRRVAGARRGRRGAPGGRRGPRAARTGDLALYGARHLRRRRLVRAHRRALGRAARRVAIRRRAGRAGRRPPSRPQARRRRLRPAGVAVPAARPLAPGPRARLRKVERRGQAGGSRDRRDPAHTARAGPREAAAQDRRVEGRPARVGDDPGRPGGEHGALLGPRPGGRHVVGDPDQLPRPGGPRHEPLPDRGQGARRRPLREGAGRGPLQPRRCPVPRRAGARACGREAGGARPPRGVRRALPPRAALGRVAAVGPGIPELEGGRGDGEGQAGRDLAASSPGTSSTSGAPSCGPTRRSRCSRRCIRRTSAATPTGASSPTCGGGRPSSSAPAGRTRPARSTGGSRWRGPTTARPWPTG